MIISDERSDVLCYFLTNESRDKMLRFAVSQTLSIVFDYFVTFPISRLISSVRTTLLEDMSWKFECLRDRRAAPGPTSPAHWFMFVKSLQNYNVDRPSCLRTISKQTDTDTDPSGWEIKNTQRTNAYRTDMS